MERRTNAKSSKGITLIALVISIIVMLILAGVSISAIVGEDGVISKAQQATYMQSVAVLEEFLQDEYVNLYLDYNEDYEKLDIVRKNHGEYFYKPTQTGLSYILIDGHMYFLIDKDGLPEEIKRQLKGGNAGDKTYQDYANFKDVYGVTSNLEVYYCENGRDTMIGAVDELKKDDAAREAISVTSTSGMGSYLTDNFDWIKTDANGNILSDGMSSIKEFTIDSNSVKNLSELYNFSALQKLYIKNANLESLEGIDLCPMLKYVYIYNSSSQSFLDLSNVANLEYLYFESITQSTLEKCMSDLNETTFSNLQYLGIYNSTVTSLSPFNNLSSTTKANVNYLYAYNLRITDLQGIENYSGLTYLEIRNNGLLTTLNGGCFENLTTLNAYSCPNLINIDNILNARKLKYLSIYSTGITSLSALENCSDIRSINANSCKLGDGKDNSKSTNNALYSLRNKNLLNSLSLEKNLNLVYTEYIKDNTAITSLYLAGCDNLNATEVALLKPIIKRCGTNYSLPTNLGIVMIDSDTKRLDLEGEEIEIEQFESLGNYTNLKYLCLKDITLKNSGVELSAEEYDNKINSTLANLTKLETISLYGINNLSKINFVTSCPNLTEIDVRNTKVTTNENGLNLLNDYCNNIIAVACNNPNDDFSNIQSAINKMNTEGSANGSWVKKTASMMYGLYCQNQTALDTLKKCKDITCFVTGAHVTYTFDLTNCSKLEKVYIYTQSGGKIKLPTQASIQASIAEEESKGNYSYSNDINTLSYTCKFIDVYDNSITGGFGCTSLLIRHPYTSSSENFWKLLEGFKNSSTLKEVEFGFTSTSNATHIKSSGLSIFEGCINLKKLTWYGRQVTPYIGNADDLGPLANITSLEEIYFDYITASKLPNLNRLTNLKKLSISTSLLMDINGLKDCTNIEYLYLYNNNIQDLYAISNLSNLNYLNLENNSITNGVTTITNGFVDNVKVLNTLKNAYNKLSELRIANNRLEDVSELQWATTK